MSRNKRRGNWLSRLNVFFWGMATVVWGVIIYESLHPNQQQSAEPVTDIVHVTGSSQAPPPASVREPTPEPVIPTTEALLVFIIDDFGPAWNQKVVDGFIDFPADLTISVIPGNRKSREVGRQAAEAGKEVFIHLPMEPSERVALGERDMVWVKSSRNELSTAFDRAVEDLPHAVGLNNHMGSRATTNKTLMEHLANELWEKGLYFVDSRTSERSVALSVMQKAGIPSLGRDVFLDVDADSASVAARIEDAARIARKRGWAISIGHVRKATLSALQAAAPKLERQGFKIVSVGELIRRLDRHASRPTGQTVASRNTSR